ncbi:MAG: hypothetical protein ACPGN3_05050 [Opitutales bacterium]
MTTNQIKGHSILLIFGALLVAFVANRGFRGEFATYLEAAENRFLIDAEALEASWEQYRSTAEKAIDYVDAGEYRKGASLLNANYRNFEWFFENRANVFLSSGETLSEAHRRLRLSIKKRFEDVYAETKALVAQGDMRPRAMREFLNYIPFNYQNRLAIRWKSESSEVEVLRAEQASKWIFVSVDCEMRNSEPYERTVRDWLISNVSELDGYKLVLGAPMGELDEAAAFRHIAITLEGDFVWYQFDRETGIVGSREVYETLRLNSEVARIGNSVLETTWDSMHPLHAHVEAPETVRFEFDVEEEEHRPNFEPFIAQQRDALLEALGDALSSWPTLALMVGNSGEMATASR